MQTTSTTRRSKRRQQILTPSRRVAPDAASWSGDAILIRDTELDDLWGEEQDGWERNVPSKTAFYEAFQRKNTTPNFPRTRKTVIDTYRIGDTVMISTTERLPSIAVIVSMWEIFPTEPLAIDAESDDEDNGINKMRIKVHWFLRPTELAPIGTKRKHLENEIYFSLESFAILSTSQIIRPCVVASQKPLIATSPGKPPLKMRSREHVSNDKFFCQLAVDRKRGLYYGFDWESHRQDAMQYDSLERETGHQWNVAVQKGIENRGSKRKLQDIDQDSDIEHTEQCCSDTSEDFDDDNLSSSLSSSRSSSPSTDTPTTPTTRRTRFLTTPKKNPRKTTSNIRSSRRTFAAPTPHSKAALRRRAQRKPIVGPPQEQYHMQTELLNLPNDAWLRAMHVLHVAARPDALPCRGDEYGLVLQAVEDLLEEGSGGCVYISGVPGTGKTATVHAVVRELRRMAENGEANPFTYVEINGLRIPEPSAAYALLWESVSGHDVSSEGHLKMSSKEAMKQLTRHFSAGVRAGPRGHACVVLMDELDQLMTAKQEVIYNFFNWPTLSGSKLIVLAVANTMDLPERVMTGRVRSRLGMTRINFKPYNSDQLIKIVQARLLTAREGLKGEVNEVIVPDAVKFAAKKVASITGDARRVLDICRRTVELVQPFSRAAKMNDLKAVIQDMQNSPTAAYLEECSFHERLMLASLLKCMKREGVEEVKWGEIKYQHLTYMNFLPDQDESSRKPTQSELSLVLCSLVTSRAVLMEDGVTVSRKPEDERKVILNLEREELQRVLGDTGGKMWKNILNA